MFISLEKLIGGDKSYYLLTFKNVTNGKKKNDYIP